MALGWIFLALVTINVAYGANYECIKCENNVACNFDDVSGVVQLPTEKCEEEDFGCYTAKQDGYYFRGCAKTYKQLLDDVKEKNLQVTQICTTDKCNKVRKDKELKCYQCTHCPDTTLPNTADPECKKVPAGEISLCYTNMTGDNVERGCTTFSDVKKSDKYLEVCAHNDCNNQKVDMVSYQCVSCENESCRSENLLIESCNNHNIGCYTTVKGQYIKLGCAKDEEDLHQLGEGARTYKPCNTTLCNLPKFSVCNSCENDKCFEENTNIEICTSMDKGCYTHFTDKEMKRGCATIDTPLPQTVGVCSGDYCNNEKAYRCLHCTDEDCEGEEQEIPTTYCGANSYGCYSRTYGKGLIHKEKGCASSKEKYNHLRDQSVDISTACQTDFCNKDEGYNCYTCKGGSKCDKPKISSADKVPTELCNDEAIGCMIIKKDNNYVRGCVQDLSELKVHVNEGYALLSLCDGNRCNANVPSDAVSTLSCYVCENCPHPESSNTQAMRCTHPNQIVEQQVCYTIHNESFVSRDCVGISEVSNLLEKAIEVCPRNVCNNKKEVLGEIIQCYACENEGCFDDEKIAIADCSTTYAGCYTKWSGDEVEKGCVEQINEVNDWKMSGYYVTTCRSQKCNNQQLYQCKSCHNDACISESYAGKEVCTDEDTGCYTFLNGSNVIQGCAHEDATFLEDKNLYFTEPATNNLPSIYRCYNCSGAECNGNVDSTTYCSVESKGCYILHEGKVTERGCAKNETVWKNLLGRQGQLVGPCRYDKCNGNKPVAYQCISCKNNVVCNVDDVTGVKNLDVETCNKNQVGCFTAKKVSGDSSNAEYFRGCAKTIEDLKTEVAQNNAKIVSICTGDSCNENRPEDKESAMYCFQCDDCKNPLKENTGTVQCDSLNGEIQQQVCYTNKTSSGMISRGCIESTKLTNETMQNLIDVCSYPGCNNKGPSNEQLVSCYDCTDCAKLSENAPVKPCLYTFEKGGCYFQMKDDKVNRGCAASEHEFEQLKINGTVLPACQTDNCNNYETCQCYSCNNNKECRDPKATNVTSTICPIVTDAGCFIVPEKTNTYRGCALNQEDVKKNNPRNITVETLCQTDFCNHKITPNGAGFANPSMLVVSLVTIGAFYLNF